MAISETAANLALDAGPGSATFVSLHTASISDPTAPNEVTGGSPAYARKSITWNSASSSALDSSNQPAFDVPSGTTVTHVGFWNHATNQTAAAYRGQLALSSSATFSTQGTLTLTDVDWTAS